MKTQGRILKAVLACSLLLSGAPCYAANPGDSKPGFTPVQTHNDLSGSPATTPSGSVIYFTSEDGNLYAIDPTTGSAVPGWPLYINNVGNYNKSASGGGELISSPVVACDGGTIYVASIDKNLYSVSPNQGIIWAKPIGNSRDPSVGALAIGANCTVYATWDDDSHLYAVNNQGTILWSLDLATVFNSDDGDVRVDSAPVVGADGTIYLYAVPMNGSGEEVLVAVQDQGSSAVVKWIVNLGFTEEQNDFQTTMALDNSGRIYVPYSLGSQGSSSLQAFNTANGSPAWNLPFSLPLQVSFHTSPALATNGTIYIGADDGLLYAINSNGALKWSYDTQTHQPIRSSPTVAADGTIVFGAANGLWSVKDNGASAQQSWFHALPKEVDSSPLILGSDNSVYIGCADGNLYAVYGSAPLAASAWPMFDRVPQRRASLAAKNCVLASIQAEGYSPPNNTTISLGTGQSFPIYIALSSTNNSNVRVHLRFDNSCGGACYNQDYTLTDYEPSPCDGGCLQVDDWYGTCQPQPHFYFPPGYAVNYFYLNTTAYANGCVTMTILPDEDPCPTYQVDPNANSITFEINQ